MPLSFLPPLGILLGAPLALLLSLPGNERIPDRIDLAGGAHVEGRIVFEDAARLVLRSGTGEKTYDRKDVKSYRSRAKLHRDALDRWIGMPPDDTSRTLELARFCSQEDLLEDARTWAWYVLLADKDNAEAHALLDHRKHGATWDARAGRDGEARPGKDRWVPFEKLLQKRPDWEEAQELATLHYLVRTNCGQETAVTSALDLEGFYRAFYDQFGPGLELHDVVDPLQVEIHADKQSFPPIATGRDAYTLAERNEVEVDASAAFHFGEVVHEATHQLIAATTRLAFADKGATIPGWLDEGLAEYMRSQVGGLAGRRGYTPGVRLADAFAIHAAAKNPYDLSRVLQFGSSDFLASSRSDLKYAQSYTLVFFCLHGDGGKYKDRFLKFLRSAWQGSSSKQDFLKALKIDEPAFTKAWLADVRSAPK